MTGRTRLADGVLTTYIILFFLYLFLPLLLMSAAAFNASDTPSVMLWKGWTLDWFRALPHDERMMQGLFNSILVALGVISLSLPLGLSGAMILTHLQSKFSGLLYTLLVSPILTPGIILGITTMIFWRDMFGVQAGLFTAMIAQTSFIASFCMLMFMARLQRKNPSLEEAALDLGASPLLVFRRVTLPFLGPTIFTATVVAFLQSFENYNTTFFAIGGDHTLVTEIGSRMRFGLSPIINAIGFIFMLLTIIAALLYTLLKYRVRQPST